MIPVHNAKGSHWIYIKNLLVYHKRCMYDVQRLIGNLLFTFYIILISNEQLSKNPTCRILPIVQMCTFTKLQSIASSLFWIIFRDWWVGRNFKIGNPARYLLRYMLLKVSNVKFEMWSHSFLAEHTNFSYQHNPDWIQKLLLHPPATNKIYRYI